MGAMGQARVGVRGRAGGMERRRDGCCRPSCEYRANREGGGWGWRVAGLRERGVASHSANLNKGGGG